MTLLKRRQPRSLARKTREAVWPSMGWRRTVHYYRHRLFRGGDSTYRITAGLATGASVSFNPFLGTHAVQTFALCWMMRASLLAGFVGTAVGNPTTFPFIFWLTYHIGVWLLTLIGLGEMVRVPDSDSALDAAVMAQGRDIWAFFAYMFDNPLKLFLPLAAGGLIAGALLWPFFYVVAYYPVRGAQRAYELQRALRLKLKQERREKQDKEDAS